MSFGLYIIGFLIVIGGLVYGAVILHVPNIGLRWAGSYYWASRS